MNAQVVRSFGIGLFAVAGLLAFLLAAGVFSPPGVGAHCPPEDGHEDFRSSPVACEEDSSGHQETHQNVIEVDGGRDRTLVFKAYVPDGVTLNDGETIAIDLTGFDLSGAAPTVSSDLISVSGSADGATVYNPTAVVVTGETLRITLPNFSPALGENEYLIITIKKGTGILPLKLLVDSMIPRNPTQ